MNKMNKKIVRTALVVCLALFTATSTFAAKPLLFSTSIKSLGTPIMPITVEAPQTVVDWFKAKGVNADAYGTDLEKMPVATRNAIRSLYSDDDNKAAVDKLALTALKAYLKEGSVEQVSTSFGPIAWSVQYSQSANPEVQY